MRYLIWVIIVLVGWGISIAWAFSDFEVRDERVEFPSDFREGLVELAPDIIFSPLPPELLRATEMPSIEVSDPKQFLELQSYRPGGQAKIPSLTVTVEIEENESGANTGIRIIYGSLLYFMNAMDDNHYVDAVQLLHIDRYDWPGHHESWTALDLDYTHGSFHYDIGNDIWYVILAYTVVAVIIGAIGFVFIPRRKPSKVSTKN